VVVEQVALPPESALVEHPVKPLQVMVPVGVPAPGVLAATVAVQVIDWPKLDGFGVQPATVVVVLSLFTTCE
jgi:hypothetical protein